MSFSISARTLLELGKELISSDDVAIYELIKNAVDAKSPRVEITVQVVVSARTYARAVSALDDGKTPRVVFDALVAAIPADVPQDLADQFRQALQDSLSNATKFKIALENAYRELNWIKVTDQGHGMSLEDLRDIYLRIGTRFRRQDNTTGARYLGDKGVGRLSAMRLGDHLRVATTKKGLTNWYKLDISWDLFTHDRDDNLSDIVIAPTVGAKKSSNDTQGTTIKISKLNSDWTLDKFSAMVSGRIARLIDPFEPGKANNLITIRYNGTRILIPSIPSSLLESAHAVCNVRFFFDQYGEPTLEGVLNYKLRNKQLPVNQKGAEILSIAQHSFRKRGKKGHAAVTNTPISPAALKRLGEFSCDIYWYNRRVVEAISDLTENQRATRELIRVWSGGPMLYRHGFRVLPYGDPDDDWLALDKEAFGKSGFKLNRQQVIGRVLVKSAHTALSEQTNREGLVQSEEADALRTILVWLLNSELRELINKGDEDEQLSKREAESGALAFKATQEEVKQALTALKSRVVDEDRAYLDRLEREVNSLAGQCASLVSRLDKTVSEAKEDREKFIHLAGIGLITEFIFHELDRSVSHTLKLLVDAQKTQREAALKALEEQLKSLQKRVSQFDDMTGEKRQTKTLCQVSEVINLVLKGHENEFARHNIHVSFEGIASAKQIKAVRGMLIQILENLIANSVYWLKQQANYEPDFRPSLDIVWDDTKSQILVVDNGPGVAAARCEIIFQPFITSKPADQGRGLGLYISRYMANYHGWSLEMDSEIGRVRENRLNGFVLDFVGDSADAK